MHQLINLIKDELFKHDLTLDMDEYGCGHLNGKPFRLTTFGIDFSVDDNFDRFANSECVSFDVYSKKDLRKMVRFIRDNLAET